MNDDNGAPDHILRELANMLRNPQIPVQARVAADLGVDQPFISNARNGRLKRITPRVRRLFEYASLRVSAAEAGMAAGEEIDAAVAAGAPKVRRSDSRFRRGLINPAGGAKSYDEDALAGIKAYLDDGYDARLIVEQIAVLRRAQRVRRPGRQT